MWKKRIEIKPDEERVIKNVERARQKTFDRAVNLLGYKPRSVVELRSRLMEKEWTNAAIVEEVIVKLEGYGYLNDGQFAKDFAASQIRQKPIGKRVLKQKLALKKLDKETVDEAIEKAFEETPEKVKSGAGCRVRRCCASRRNRTSNGPALAPAPTRSAPCRNTDGS